MRPGINVGGDPAYPPGAPDPGLLRELGFGWVRLVSLPEKQPYVGGCGLANIATLGVVTEQSGGYIPGTTWLQIGNEPNRGGLYDPYVKGQDGMGAPAYASYLQNYRANVPADRPMIAGGMIAFGDPTYLKVVRDSGGLKGYSAVALHYPRSSSDIWNWAQYAGLPIWITEWRTQGGGWFIDQIPDAVRVFRQHGRVVAHAPFCWSSAMVGGFGISDDPRIMHAILGMS